MNSLFKMLGSRVEESGHRRIQGLGAGVVGLGLRESFHLSLV